MMFRRFVSISLFLFFIFASACAKPLPVLGELPDFSFQNQNEVVIRKTDLLGKVWVADFIFTSCGGICPALTVKMRELQTRTYRDRDMIRFVSFTVDPERDTPERLRNYANALKVDSTNWFFLTGARQSLEDMILRGFKISMGQGDDSQLIHGEKFVLVDRHGRIRGYYDADEKGLKDLYAAMKQLLKP